MGFRPTRITSANVRPGSPNISIRSSGQPLPVLETECIAAVQLYRVAPPRLAVHRTMPDFLSGSHGVVTDLTPNSTIISVTSFTDVKALLAQKQDHARESAGEEEIGFSPDRQG